MRAVDNADRAVEKFMDDDVALGEAAAEFRGLDLKDEIIPAYGVVASDGSLFFDRKDEVKVFAAKRSESGSLLRRIFDKELSVIGQKGFEDVTVGIRKGFDAVKF